MNAIIFLTLVFFLFRLWRWFYVWSLAPDKLQKAEDKFQKAEDKLRQAEAISMPADKTGKESWQKKIDQFTALKDVAERNRDEAKKLTGKWQSFVQSNNLDPLWILLLFILCLFATILTPTVQPPPFEAGWGTETLYLLKEARLGKYKADIWLSQRPKYPFLKREWRAYTLFAGWKKTFFVFLLFFASIPWAFYPEVHSFFIKRANEKRKREGKEGFTPTEVSLAILVFTEVVELLHQFGLGKKKVDIK